MLEELARKGHLQLQQKDSDVAYAPSASNRRALPGEAPAPSDSSSPDAGSEDGESSGRLVAHERLDEPLSERELEVLNLLASGKTNSEAARDLFVSVGTIKSHTGNIYRKLGAKNRAGALTRARELGLIR